MGTTTSRERSTSPKRKKLISLKNNNNNNKKQVESIVISTNEQPLLDSTPATQTILFQPVQLVKHQVVLSDYVEPMPSLSLAAVWRKSNTTNASHLSSCFDDHDFDSPRTSLEDDGFLTVDDSLVDKRKSSSSFISSYKKEGSNIIFESKYGSNTEDTSYTVLPPRPLWTYSRDDEKEYERQLRQHYVLKHVLNGNIHLPIPADEAVTILDFVCGAGFWTLDMAGAFPNATLVGLDAFPNQKSSANNVSAPNIVFKHGDLNSHLSLPDNYFDIIYQRDIISILPHERWSFLFNDYFRILKPDGYVELVEHDFNIRDPGPVLALINEWYKAASSSVGIHPRETMNFQSMLTNAGFKNIKRKVISVPIGEWPTNQEEREKGFLYQQVIVALFKSMKAWFMSELGVSEQEYDKVVNAAIDEFDEQCCYMDWYIYTAEKTNP